MVCETLCDTNYIDYFIFPLSLPIFQHTVGTVGGTKCAPRLAGLFLYAYVRLHAGVSQEKRKEVQLVL
jgi:hypothetical protein